MAEQTLEELESKTLEELEFKSLLSQRKDLREKILNEGQTTGAIANIGFDSSVALIKSILRQRGINKLRKLQSQRAAALRQATVTDADMAEYQAIADAAVREAGANVSRGGGQGGLDVERLQMARDLALKKFAQKLTATQKGRIADKARVGAEMQEDAQELRGMESNQIESTFKDVKDVVKDPGTVALLGQRGIKDREGKTSIAIDALKAREEERLKRQLGRPPLTNTRDDEEQVYKMAELTQGQRNVPYTKTNIFGARAVGRETAVGTGLQPEAEAMLKIELLKVLSSISKLEMEMATQSITSFSNVNTATVTARANAITAVSNAMRVGQLDLVRAQEGLETALDLTNASKILGGVNGDPKTIEKLREQFIGSRSAMMSIEGGAGLLKQIENAKGRPGYSAQTAANLIQTELSEKSALYLNNINSEIRNLELSGVPNTVIVSTKRQAQDYVQNLIDDGYRSALDAAKRLEDPDLVKYLEMPETQVSVKGSSMVSAYAGDVNKQMEPSRKQLRGAAQEVEAASKNHEIFRRKVESMGIGLPPELMSGLYEALDMNQALIDGGPEGFAESLSGMKPPLEVQMVKQSLQNQVRELEDPQDPLTNAVYKYVTSIPYYENYMAALGMDDIYEFYEYSRNNLSESIDYEEMVSALVSDPTTADNVLNPEIIRERLQVAGSSGKEGLFRTDNLTKKIERIVGFGINRGPAWRFFSGTNTEEQLDDAIESLKRVGDVEFQKQVEEASREPVGTETGASLEEVVESSGEMEDVGDPVEELDRIEEFDTSQPTSRVDRFAEQFKGQPKKIERTIRAAEKFRERIGGRSPIRGEDMKTERVLLPGLDPQYRAIPAPPPPVAATPPDKPGRTSRPSGLVSYGKTIDTISKEIDAEEAAKPNVVEENRQSEIARRRAERLAKMAARDKAGK